MHSFDWGVFNPWGELILAGSATSYLFLILTTIRRWSSTNLTARHHWVIRWIGFGAIALMVGAASISVMLQLTSAHYQGTVHAPAVAVIVGVWLSIRIVGRDPKSGSEQAGYGGAKEGT